MCQPTFRYFNDPMAGLWTLSPMGDGITIKMNYGELRPTMIARSTSFIFNSKVVVTADVSKLNN